MVSVMMSMDMSIYIPGLPGIHMYICIYMDHDNKNISMNVPTQTAHLPRI